ncbi:beta-ketoacyl synthase N-terminal-like domain-containing protein [Streptomyces sp. NPDC003036]|uniref:beta-ketoacyl synthase N-terminal-like domain-containing protein n=1 Tax=Streptomyces sp. NPDC003036 TaxID=3154442 RepID=UPI0033BF1957
MTEARTGPLAVTGLGVVGPAGVGTEAFAKAIREGISHLAPITRFDPEGFPVALAGEARDFTPSDLIEGRYLVQTDLFSQFAMATADEALADAGLEQPGDPYDVGVLICSYAGGVTFGQVEIERLWARGPRHVGPYQSIAWFYAASTGQVSIRRGLKGACAVLVTDEPGALDALGHSARELRRSGGAMLVGGAEAPVGSPFSLACQVGAGLLSPDRDPATAYRPFSPRARGYVPGEGGAVLAVETAEAAEARGARVRALVLGHATAFGGTAAFDPGGEALEHAARTALDRAGLAPGDVDLVFADALGTAEADAAEAAVLARLLPDVPVTAPKAGFGRAYAGAGALDLAAAVLALEQGFVPPTPWPDPDEPVLEELAGRLVRGAGPAAAPRTALVLSRGFGGACSAAVLARAGHPLPPLPAAA